MTIAITHLELERRKQGLNIKQLGDKANYVPNLISQVEKGFRRPWPQFRTRIAQVLGVSEDELFCDGQLKTVDIDVLLRAANQ